MEVARKRSWESEDEELKENTEVGKVVFDNKEVEDDEEVDQGGDLDNLFIEEVEEELEHLGILFQVSVGDMMKQTIYDMMRNFIILHIAIYILHCCNMYMLIAYSTVYAQRRVRNRDSLKFLKFSLEFLKFLKDSQSASPKGDETCALT